MWLLLHRYLHLSGEEGRKSRKKEWEWEKDVQTKIQMTIKWYIVDQRKKNWSRISMPLSFLLLRCTEANSVECNWMITHLIRQMSNKIQFGNNSSDNAKEERCKARMNKWMEMENLSNFWLHQATISQSKRQKSGWNRFVSEEKLKSAEI